MAAPASPGESLTADQLAAFELIAGGHSTRSVASVAGVSASTVCRWRQLPGWKQLEREAWSSAKGRIAGLADRAVRTLAKGLSGKATKEQTAAAKALLDLAVKGDDLDGLRQEMAEALERLNGARPQNPVPPAGDSPGEPAGG